VSQTRAVRSDSTRDDIEAQQPGWARDQLEEKGVTVVLSDTADFAANVSGDVIAR
jgi:hypothetical protein